VSHIAIAGTSLDRICEAIAQRGYAVETEFLPATVVASLREDAMRRDAAGEFRPAAVGRGTARTQGAGIRGDRIAWIDETQTMPAVRPWWDALERLRAALNQALYFGLFSFEGHYAIYPPGAFYQRHRDCFRGDDERVLSCVLYLNESWTEDDSGALRIYFDGGVVRDMLPTGGTLVCFLSDRFEHEVLPAKHERLALTGWFRRRSEDTSLP